MKIILNKTNRPMDRYTLVSDSMGCAGEPENHPSHKYSVANGVDRGNGYQGYTSIDYFLTQEYVPQDVKNNLRKTLVNLGYSQYS